jgi:hypothetical protein
MRKTVLILLLSLPVFAGTAHASAPRHGTIVELQPIQNRGDDETAEVKQRRKVGRFAGAMAHMGFVASGAMRKTGIIGGALGRSEAIEHGGEEAAARIGGPGATTRYMVKVRLDSKKVLSITQLRQQLDGLKVGSRVIVQGAGDQATVSAE